MGIFDPNVTTTEGTSTTRTLPAFVEKGFEDLADRAFALGDRPYIPYPEARIAEFTPHQLGGFALSQAGTGEGNIINRYGIEAAQQALRQPTLQDLQPYMNPYDEAVTQDTLRELRRQNSIQGIMDSANAVRGDAFGGSRHGVVEAERARNFERTSADILNQSNAQNYAQALQQFNQQQKVGLEGAQRFSGLAGAAQQLRQGDIGTLMQSGSLQQLQDQNQLDLAFGDFQNQLRYPYEQISYISDLIGDVPSTQQQAITQTQVPGPSTGSQIFGGLASAAGLGLAAYGAFK